MHVYIEYIHIYIYRDIQMKVLIAKLPTASCSLLTAHC